MAPAGTVAEGVESPETQTWRGNSALAKAVCDADMS